MSPYVRIHNGCGHEDPAHYNIFNLTIFMWCITHASKELPQEDNV